MALKWPCHAAVEKLVSMVSVLDGRRGLLDGMLVLLGKLNLADCITY